MFFASGALTHLMAINYNKNATIKVGKGGAETSMYTVLLVDDEPTILETLSSTICWQQFGVNTLLKSLDGYQALEIMRNHKIDLLITDIEMPNLDGLTLLKKTRETFPDVHCILLTAYGEFKYAQTALQYGVENYLLKPINKTELEETIEKALNNIYINRKNSHILFFSNSKNTASSSQIPILITVTIAFPAPASTELQAQICQSNTQYLPSRRRTFSIPAPLTLLSK